MTALLATAIEDFWEARARGDYFPAAYANRLSLDDAYRLQLALIKRRVAAGETRIGWKVGLTAKAIQQQFGFFEPVFGCILEARASGHVFPAGSLIKPGFETELCLTLGRDLGSGASVDMARAAVALVQPAFEIIETRGDFVAQIALALADNAQQRSVILGEGVPLGTCDLAKVEARVSLNGAEIAVGEGSAVLGDPLHSLAWLAGKLPDYGEQLRAGDIVMTGSFVRQFPLSAGDRAAATFSGIGRVEAALAA